MKFFAPLIVSVVAMHSTLVDANGVCYDPDHFSSDLKNADSVLADMKLIKSNGFNIVRTFISQFGNTTEIGPIINAANLTAALGVPYPQADTELQKAAAIKAAKAGNVAYIFVGNENLAGATTVPSDMLALIQEIKSQVPPSVKVGTVQRNTEVIQYSGIKGWKDLYDTVDVLGVNVHPFFNPGTTADNALSVLKTQWEVMKDSFSEKLLLTETGWPSGGSVLGNTGSLEGMKTFFSDYKQWSSSLKNESFYFQAFDTPLKTLDYEKSYGLLTSGSQPKFDIASASAVNGVVSPSP